MAEYKVFGQRYRVQFADRVYDQRSLDVDFDILHDNSAESKSSKIELYNVSDVTYSRLEVGLAITVDAGYVGHRRTILVGKVTGFYQEPSGGDIKTTILASVESNAWYKDQVNETWIGPTTVDAVVRSLLTDFSSYSNYLIEPGINRELPKGFSFQGYVRDALVELANDSNSLVYNDSNTVFFIPANKKVLRTVTVESKNIINSPKRLEKGGVKLRVFLNGEITPNTQVIVNSKFGRYVLVATKVKHVKQDTTNFYTEIVGDEVGTTN